MLEVDDMDENRIRESLKYGERVTLECKEAHGKIPNTVYETYSSFANTMGGLILLGVKENIGNSGSEPRFVFVGVDNPEKRIKEFWDVINSNKVSANILMEDNVGYCVVEGKTIIWIDVPQADSVEQNLQQHIQVDGIDPLFSEHHRIEHDAQAHRFDIRQKAHHILCREGHSPQHREQHQFPDGQLTQWCTPAGSCPHPSPGWNPRR